MEEAKSKVYILTDPKNRIIRLDGGYSISNVDTSAWTFIDEGMGDRYNLCQSHYLDKPLMTNDGIYQYKYIDGIIKERTIEEIEADRQALPKPQSEPSISDEVEELKAQLTDVQLALCEQYELNLALQETINNMNK